MPALIQNKRTGRYSLTVKSATSPHTFYVQTVDQSELPHNIATKANDYTGPFYTVKNSDHFGVVFMYLARGYRYAPKEIVAYYPNGEQWSGFGTNIPDAIHGAQRDGWLHTR